MKWDQLECSWKEFAGSARAHWGKLTGDDCEVITGRKEQLVGQVQIRYGIAKEAAEKQVEEWSHSLQSLGMALRTHGSPEEGV